MPATDGWHWKEWLAELAGTAALMFAVVTAKYWAVQAGPPFSDPEVRIAIVALVAGLAVLAVAVSPLGRRSGAHLNPAVTMGFWLLNVTGRADVAGYCAGQLAGGIAGFGAGRLWGPGVADAPVDWAVIAPAKWLSPVIAAVVEAAATFALLLPVFVILASPRYHRWAALAASILLTAGIVALATISGAGFSPVRGLAPDVLAASYPAAWIYFAGPAAGGVLAGIAARRRSPLTGKLRHDPALPCYQRCALEHDEHGRPGRCPAEVPIEDPGAAGRPSDLRRAL